MLLHVIFAFNKRAKIYKEEEKNYSYKYYDGYNNQEKYERLKNEAYNCKRELLEFLEPSAIHKIIKIREKNIRYYDWEPEYFQFTDEEILKRGEFFDFDLKRVVEFIAVKEIEKEEKLFLYYSFNGFKFHVPTSKLKDTLEVIQVYNIASEVVDEKKFVIYSILQKSLYRVKGKKININDIMNKEEFNMVFVGGYYEKKNIGNEELKVFDDIKIYNLEEALNLPFVEGIEEFYNDRFEEPEDRTNEFYELSDEMLEKLIIEYVKYDEIATLYAFDTELEAKEFIENYRASIE